MGSKWILSNNLSREILWVRDTCLVVGLLLLIIMLITASLSWKICSIATNDLRDSAKGSNDGYDVAFSLTGYEPNDTELHNTVSSEFIDSQGPLFYVAPSSDLDIDDTTLGKLLAEVHREYADYRSPEGVFVSPSSMSVTSDRTGKPVEKSNIDHFLFLVSETRTVLTISFLQSLKLKE